MASTSRTRSQTSRQATIGDPATINPISLSSPSLASKKRKMDAGAPKFYAVRRGQRPGVYTTWAECKQQTAGFKGAQYKSFLSRKDAEAFVAGRNPQSTAVDGTKQDKFYAVARGRKPGVYTDWDMASLAIKGWKAPKFKRFDTRTEAEEFIRTHGNVEGQGSLLADIVFEDEDGEGDEDADGEGEKDDDVAPPSKKRKVADTVLRVAQDGPGVQHIYTDGSSLSNGRAGAAAGVGVYFGAEDHRNLAERLEGEQTNQRAELTAILRALQMVTADQDIRIITDSKYAISCVTDWFVNWKKNGWKTKGGPVKNRDIVEAIRVQIDNRDALGTQTLFQWVKGHDGTPGNVAADHLAIEGARLPTLAAFGSY